MFSSITLHDLTLLRQRLLLNLQLSDSARLSGLQVPGLLLCLGVLSAKLQTYSATFGFCVGAAELNSSPHPYAASTVALSHLPSPFLIFRDHVSKPGWL